MPARQIVPRAAIAALVLAVFTSAPASAGTSNMVVAQAGDVSTASRPTVHRRRPPTRITVYPTDRLYRDCNTFYEVQHRLSGDVIYPQINCQWSVR
jgi:hypothetical protein